MRITRIQNWNTPLTSARPTRQSGEAHKQRGAARPQRVHGAADHERLRGLRQVFQHQAEAAQRQAQRDSATGRA